jgi:TonB family protein
MTEDWTNWESRVVDGVFPLLRFLGRSDHTVVFATKLAHPGDPGAAIKLVPAEPARAEAQLARWRTHTSLSHPHVIRLFAAGRCELGGHPFLYVVTEYAEQTLAQILPHRALSPDEVREMLVPTLDALGFLHGKGLCHGGLKPSNILVVNDQLKLAGDFIHAANDSLGDAPASDTGAAADVRDLGVTIVEALTQRPPIPSDDGSDALSLPASVAAEFAGIVQRCLSRNPASRPTIAELAAYFSGVPSIPPTQASQPAAQEPTVPAAKAREPVNAAREPVSEPQFRVPRTAIVAGLVLLAAAGIALPIFHRHQASQQLAAYDPQPAVPEASAAVQTAAASPPPSAPASATVLHQEIPEISHRARSTIRGTIKVSVRVKVDAAGNVVGATLESRGSSKYFARLASNAARKWKFAASDTQGRTERQLRFEFSRDGASAQLAY